MIKGRWDPDGSDGDQLWRHARLGKPSRIFWIPPGCRDSLTKPDDRTRFAAVEPAPAPLSGG